MEIYRIDKSSEDLFLHLMPGSLSYGQIALGAVCDEKAVGCCIFTDEDTHLILEHIYVAKDYRRRGIGTAMIQRVVEILTGSSAVCILTYYIGSEECDGFLDSLGFFTIDDLPVYSVPVYSLDRSPILARYKDTALKSAKKIKQIDRFEKSEKQILKSVLTNAGFKDSVMDEDSYSEDFSFAYLHDDNKGILLSKYDEDIITVTALCVEKPSLKLLLALTGFFITEVLDNLPIKTSIRFIGSNDKILDFLESVTKSDLDDPELMFKKGVLQLNAGPSSEDMI